MFILYKYVIESIEYRNITKECTFSYYIITHIKMSFLQLKIIGFKNITHIIFLVIIYLIYILELIFFLNNFQ